MIRMHNCNGSVLFTENLQLLILVSIKIKLWKKLCSSFYDSHLFTETVVVIRHSEQPSESCFAFLWLAAIPPPPPFKLVIYFARRFAQRPSRVTLIRECQLKLCINAIFLYLFLSYSFPYQYYLGIIGHVEVCTEARLILLRLKTIPYHHMFMYS